MKPLSQTLLAMLLCAAVSLPAYAAKATAVDVGGRSYDVASARLVKGGKLKIICGGTRLDVPFKSVRSMKIDPAQITPVGGQPYFGVEIVMRDGSVIGDIGERGRCLVAADNGLKGKTSKSAGFSIPFSDLSSILILGKDDAKAKQGGGDDDEDDEDDD